MMNREFFEDSKDDINFLIDIVMNFQEQIKLDRDEKKIYLKKIKSLEHELKGVKSDNQN
jgi:hypothetical protein